MLDVEAVKRAVLEILSIGILNIRGHASKGDAKACFVEADHLHNLPDILKAILRGERCDALVDYYYKIERPAFLAYAKSHTDHFQASWAELAKAMGVEQRN